jgi:phytoene synthase
MDWDLVKKAYRTRKETLRYMYGSAEVVGLMMARILGLPEKAEEPARYLGRAMQHINFIRDIREDLLLGRTYFPLDEMKKAGLKILKDDSDTHFRPFIKRQLALYREWQARGEKGFALIPRRFRIPVRTASDMYNWTARTIARNPGVVFRKKIKPSLPRVLFTALINTLCPERKGGSWNFS